MTTPVITPAPTAPAAAAVSSPIPGINLNTAGSFMSDFMAAPSAPIAPPVAEPAQPEQLPVEAPPADAPANSLPSVEQLIEEFRAQHPEAPDSVLKRLADKEHYIQELAAKDKAKTAQITQLLARVTKKDEAGQQQLTELERSALAPPQQASPATQPPAVGQSPFPAQPPAEMPQQSPQQQPAQQPLPEYLATPETAHTALLEAMAEGNVQRAAQIEGEITQLRFHNQFLPQIQHMIQAEAARLFHEQMQQQFGDILPTIRQTAHQQQVASIVDTAVAELAQSGVDIQPLMAEVDSTPIEHEGRMYPNTVLNQIFAAHPGLLRIRVDHPDPKMAQALTIIARYREAASIAQMMGRAGQPAQAQQQPAPQAADANGIAPSTAQQYLEAGRQQALREEQDRVRQSINSGPGSTASPTQQLATSAEQRLMQGADPIAGFMAGPSRR